LKLFARILLFALAGLLVWQIAALGISGYYVDRLRDGDPAAAEKALAWVADQPEAALRKGLETEKADPGLGQSLLRAAYAQNPADARPLIAVAGRAQGDKGRAEAMVRQAVRLDPSDPAIQEAAAAFWVAQGDLNKAMQHWSVALEAQPTEQSQLFPLFLRLAEDPKTRGVFQAFAGSPPPWWDAFFDEVARRAIDLETVRTLYGMRREAKLTPISPQERKAYVARLQKDGRITEAYLVWVNGLSDEERGYLGMLNNGSFELPPANAGFGWHIRKTNGVDFTEARTTGVEGERALHILFKRWEGTFSNVFQPLFLDPGTYELTGRVRTDELDSIGGLKWVTRCTEPSQDLGESGRFLGSGDWRSFSFRFQVPEDCTAQEIRLVSAGTRPFEAKITGGIWFDSMALRKIAVPAATKTSGPG
jgi:tetratricopeptide (TPR) repeat protein